MDGHDRMGRIIKAGTPEFGIRQNETRGPHQIHLHAEAGAKPQNGSGILGDVRFEKG